MYNIADLCKKSLAGVYNVSTSYQKTLTMAMWRFLSNKSDAKSITFVFISVQSNMPQCETSPALHITGAS